MTTFINYCTSIQFIDYCENGQLETALRDFIREHHGQDVIVRFGTVCKLSFPSADAVRMRFNESFDCDWSSATFSGIRRFNRQKIEYLAGWFARECAEVISRETA